MGVETGASSLKAATERAELEMWRTRRLLKSRNIWILSGAKFCRGNLWAISMSLLGWSLGGSGTSSRNKLRVSTMLWVNRWKTLNWPSSRHRLISCKESFLLYCLIDNGKSTTLCTRHTCPRTKWIPTRETQRDTLSGRLLTLSYVLGDTISCILGFLIWAKIK